MKNDTTTIEVKNLFENKGVVLGAEDMQKIVNYAIKNEIVKVSIVENDVCCDDGDVVEIDSLNKLKMSFENHTVNVLIELNEV